MKNKKRSIFTKKQILIMVIVAVLAFILILAIALNPTGKKTLVTQSNNNQDLNRELKTVEDVVKYYDSVYYKTTKSSEEGYDIDIYVGFRFNLFEDGQSKESFFKSLYERIAIVTEFQSFRLIDQDRNITISVKCNNGKISEVLFNGILDFYKKELSKQSQDNELKVENVNVDVESEVLNKLISSGWNIKQVDIGSVDSTCEKYDIYFDEGYEVRTIQNKVFNIVFKTNYEESIINGYKPGVNLEKVKAQLGESYNQYGFLGYKTKDFYIYFSEDEISIYPNSRYEYSEFEDLVREYDKDNNINEFMNKLTDIWPDYDKYEYDSSYFEIWYTLKGVKIHYNNTNPQGIQIYENYKGDLKENKEELRDVYYKLNENLLIEKEQIRIMSYKVFDNSGIETDPIHHSNKFYFMPGSTFKTSKVISIDGQNPNSDIDILGEINTYVWCDDTHLLFSIPFKGMYMFDAKNRRLDTLLENKDSKFEITDFNRENKILEYDGIKVQIDF